VSMRFVVALLLFILYPTLWALSLIENAPQRYVVKEGDTMWSIASQYLSGPWEWKSLWRANPQIKHPAHLYPGYVIALKYFQGKPYLQVSGKRTVKLSPYIRTLPPDNPIPPIPLSDIKPFLDGSVILDRDTLKNAPYVVGFTTEHMLGSQGDEIYVKNLSPPRPPRGVTFSYAIYRPCGKFNDSFTKCPVGYMAQLIGYAELVKGGDPATILITDIEEGVKLADRVVPNTYPDFDLNFLPKTPKRPVSGKIIDIPGDYNQGAVGLVAVINRGKDSGLEPGDVLAILEVGKSVKSPLCPDCVKLPVERIGEIMVFRTFRHTSFGLVVRSIRAIQMGNKVASP
jgi:hypothetical protein